MLITASFSAQTPPPPPAAVGVTVTPGEHVSLAEVQEVPSEPDRWREKGCLLPLWARLRPARIWHGGCMRVAYHLCEGPCKGFCTAFHVSQESVHHMLLVLAVCHSGLTWVSRATHSHALPVPPVIPLASSDCCLTPSFPTPHSAPVPKSLHGDRVCLPQL